MCIRDSIIRRHPFGPPCPSLGKRHLERRRTSRVLIQSAQQFPPLVTALPAPLGVIDGVIAGYHSRTNEPKKPPKLPRAYRAPYADWPDWSWPAVRPGRTPCPTAPFLESFVVGGHGQTGLRGRSVDAAAVQPLSLIHISEPTRPY